MSIIKRYNQVAEYSEFMSTSRSRKGRRVHFADDPRESVLHVASGERSPQWREALCPSFADIQGALRRFQNHPDLSQDQVFCFMYPIFMFALLCAFAVAAFQPKSFAHHVLTDPLHHLFALVMGIPVVLSSIVFGIVLLRIIIWVVATLAAAIADMEVDQPEADSTERRFSTFSLFTGVSM